MVDLREYSFGDWFRVCLRLVPALMIAQIVWGLILVVPAAMFWFFLQFGPR